MPVAPVFEDGRGAVATGMADPKRMGLRGQVVEIEPWRQVDTGEAVVLTGEPGIDDPLRRDAPLAVHENTGQIGALLGGCSQHQRVLQGVAPDLAAPGDP